MFILVKDRRRQLRYGEAIVVATTWNMGPIGTHQTRCGSQAKNARKQIKEWNHNRQEKYSALAPAETILAVDNSSSQNAALFALIPAGGSHVACMVSMCNITVKYDTPVQFLRNSW